MQVIDQYLSQADHGNFSRTVLDERFPWYWNSAVTYRDSDQDFPDNFQFVHMLYDNFAPSSDYFSLVWPLLERLRPAALIRIKLNLNPRTAETVRFQMHRDVSDTDCATAVYYLNTNNGWTEFWDGRRVDSVANRLLTFPGPWLHTGTTCTDQKCRVVMNINYIP